MPVIINDECSDFRCPLHFRPPPAPSVRCEGFFRILETEILRKCYYKLCVLLHVLPWNLEFWKRVRISIDCFAGSKLHEFAARRIAAVGNEEPVFWEFCYELFECRLVILHIFICIKMISRDIRDEENLWREMEE